MKFSDFSKRLAKIDSTTKRNEMTTLLAEMIRESSTDEIDKVIHLSLGQIAPLYANKEFNLAEKLAIRAIALAYGKTDAEVKTNYQKSGDLGNTAESLSPNSPSFPNSPNVNQVFVSLTSIADESGAGSQERKLTELADLLRSVDPLSAKYIVRIILDKLRLGFSDKTVLDALSFVINGDKSAREKLEAAYNVRPDVGWLAKSIKSTKGIKGLLPQPQLGVPILPALCQRLPSTEEIIEKMGKAGKPVAVEPKWDGQRIQAHMNKSTTGSTSTTAPAIASRRRSGRAGNTSEIHLFTRSLEDVTSMFPDLVSALQATIQHSTFNIQHCILDGEVVAVDPTTGKILPFQTMITRKRKYGVQEKIASVPIKYMIFDILYLNGKSLMQEPFSKRRSTLEKLLPPNNQQLTTNNLSIAPQIVTSNPDEIRIFLKQQIDKGLEGIVAKRTDAPYIPGRTQFTWVKLKWEGKAKSGGLLDTIDCVVMGTYAGRGKRSSFGVGAFLVGVCSLNSLKSPISFVTISKIGTGLSDEQWRELKVKGKRIKAEGKPKEYDVPKELTPDIWLKPELVVEIQADNITKSPLHTAGFALRFPRLVRYRSDKRPTQATTLNEVKKLYQMQSKKTNKLTNLQTNKLTNLQTNKLTKKLIN